MDELKLDSWQKRFNEAVPNIQIEFNAFFKDKPIEEFYKLALDESNELSLIISKDLPKEIQERLLMMLLDTKPEDSI